MSYCNFFFFFKFKKNCGELKNPRSSKNEEAALGGIICQKI
jgi:hypothetical protein